MAQEDVELVRSLVAPAEVDWAAVVRDEGTFASLAAASEQAFEPEFEVALVSVTETRRKGVEGLRSVWEDWLEPWSTYRAAEEKVVDLGDGRVLWLGRDFGGRRDGRGEIELLSSAIWRIRSGRVAEVVFYASRADALAAAGVANP